MLRERKSTHPWVTDAVETLVEQKTDAEGTPNEREAAEQCSAGIFVSFTKYTRKCAKQLRRFILFSKAWWAKTRQFLDVKINTLSILALKSDAGTLILKQRGKAELFAEKFGAKYMLFLAGKNQYSDIPECARAALRAGVARREGGENYQRNERGQRHWPRHVAYEHSYGIRRHVRNVRMMHF